MGLEIQLSLLDEIFKGRASLFLGAGASREAGFPDAQGLAEFLVEKAGTADATALAAQPLDAVAQRLYLKTGFGKPWVRKHVIDFFEEKHRNVKRPPSRAHQAMTSLRWRTIFTTNYDRLAEIAYESGAGPVQRVLPVYAPDPQITRHEQDVVRLIKLNGSVDEAARNSSHQLVLTFAEQQEARSRNSQFYDLLREEAVNGPIIFVGFRFVHPGASLPGTSPEFLQLRELLQQMGPAARWHYCVSPFDPGSDSDALAVDILTGCRVAPIPATFEEFLEAATAHLRRPATPLAKRPPVTVPVGRTSIQLTADEYQKDKRHFEILGTYLEGLSPPSVTESLNGGENWASFLEGHSIRRGAADDLHQVLGDCVTAAPEILFLGAPPGWGKTFLLRSLAADLYRARRPVIWLNPFGTLETSTAMGQSVTLGMWDSVRIDHILGMIADAANTSAVPPDQATPIIVADNCPERAPEVLSLFADLTANKRSFVLVFAVRDYEFESLVKEYPVLTKARQFRPQGLHDSRQEVRTLIDFCADNRVATFQDSSQREVVAQTIIREEADTAIILALQVIFDKQHRPFSEIVKELWNSLQDDTQRRLVLRVASLHRFGSAFSPRLYSLLNTFLPHERSRALESYRVCLDRVLFERVHEEEPCVETLHSLVAEHLIKVSGKVPGEVDDQLIDLVRSMTGNMRDLEIIRRMLKRITDYDINLSSETKTEEIFPAAATSTSNDWVVCQQFAKYLVHRGDYELAMAWAERALEANPAHAPLEHTKGNVLRRWGMKLMAEGEIAQAHLKFREARKSFATSRVAREPGEYGYVTHLDMLLYLIGNERNELQRANLIAEGVDLFREGARAVPQDRFNYLLEDRFFRAFDLTRETTQELCAQFEHALSEGKSCVSGAAFLAQELYKGGRYDEAIAVLRRQSEIVDEGVLVWVKQAEIHAREGQFAEAARCIDSAKRRQQHTENDAVLWALMYWDLLIAIVLEDFPAARAAIVRLKESGFFCRLLFPRGYFWKQAAKGLAPDKRSFKEHAKIWSGRFEQHRAGGQYGRISVTNAAGETFYIGFNPRYFSRKDLRRGDHIEFVMTILANGLRADDINSKPFVNTQDDLFVA
jgi:tetratricopeptide (TPR) repeat protein/NAD-dependent SIR2 family protein deacetylase